LFISELVEKETSRGDPDAVVLRTRKMSGIPILTVSKDAEKLAECLLSAGAVPLKQPLLLLSLHNSKRSCAKSDANRFV
jgi:hypothetical protein